MSEHINYKQHLDNYCTSIDLQIYLKTKRMLCSETLRRNSMPNYKIICKKEMKISVKIAARTIYMIFKM